MIASHAYSLNGRTWMELQDSFGSPEEELHDVLGRLDGCKRYSLILWRLPEGKRLDETSPDNEALEYLQCAGSARHMIVEMSRLIDGQRASFLISRPVLSEADDSKEEVHWSDFVAVVRRSDVFDSSEAGRIFSVFYRTGSVPSEYVQKAGGAITRRSSGT